MAETNYYHLWARQVRGCTIAEYAVLGVLALFVHDRATGKCRIVLGHLVWRLGATRIYIRQIIRDLAKKGFLSIEPNANIDSSDLQSTSTLKLNADRFFPIGPDHDLGMRLLRSHIRDITTDSQLAKGFTEAWVERLPKRHGKKAKPVLYVAVQSQSHFELLRDSTAELNKTLKGVAPFVDYRIMVVRMYDDRRQADTPANSTF